MPSFERIDKKIQYGRGRAAQKLGQPYNVFRLTAQSNGSVIGAVPTLRNVPMMLKRTTSKSKLENVILEALAYTGTTDNRPLLPGDLLQEFGYESPGGVYCFAQRRPLKDSIFVRCENGASIYRPRPLAGAADQQPSNASPPTTIRNTDYGGLSTANRETVVLIDGVYSFELSGTIDPNTGHPYPPASIPVGLQQQNRSRDGRMPDIPTGLPRTFFVIYVSPMPGAEVAELDIIKAANADQYVVRQIQETDPVGFIGTICVVEKVAM